MSARQIIHLAPDRSNLVAYASVKADTLIENHIAHSLLLHIVVVAGCEHKALCICLFLLLISRKRESCDEFVENGLEAVLTLVLRLCRLCESVALVIAELLDGSLERLVLNIVRIIPLDVCSELCHKLLLHAAVLLDFLVSELDGIEHSLLAYLVHLTFNHHNILLGSSDHKFEVGILHLGEGRVDYKLSADAANANLTYRTAERQVGSCECAGSSEACKCVRLNILLCRNKCYIYKYFEVEITWPERADRTVNKAADENLVVACLSFPLHKSAREASCGIEFLLIIHCKWHEVSTFLDFLRSANRGEEHSASHLYYCGTVCLLGKFTGFDFNHAAIREFNLLVNYVHYCLS